jgi:hypothetical protein
MHANRLTATILFTLTTLTTACAGFEGDDFGSDFGDEDGSEERDDAGAEGHENGGDDQGDEEGEYDGDDRKPPRAGDDDGHGPDCEHDVRCPGDEGNGDEGNGDGDEEEPGEEPGDICEPRSTDLIAAQQFDTGTVTLSNTEDTFEIEVLPDAPYQLLEVHVYAGVDPIVESEPGQFPYTVEFDEPTNSYHLSIPVTELKVGCGDELNVAVHAVVVSFEDGAEVFNETAWMFGNGNMQFDEGWGWSWAYSICCEG